MAAIEELIMEHGKQVPDAEGAKLNDLMRNTLANGQLQETHFLYRLFLAQLKVVSGSAHAARWHPDIKAWALLFKERGGAGAYAGLVGGPLGATDLGINLGGLNFPLPSNTTLRLLLSRLGRGRGLHVASVLLMLDLLMALGLPLEWTLAQDSTLIKPGLAEDPFLGVVEGGMDLLDFDAIAEESIDLSKVNLAKSVQMYSLNALCRRTGSDSMLSISVPLGWMPAGAGVCAAATEEEAGAEAEAEAEAVPAAATAATGGSSTDQLIAAVTATVEFTQRCRYCLINTLPCTPMDAENGRACDKCVELGITPIRGHTAAVCSDSGGGGFQVSLHFKAAHDKDALVAHGSPDGVHFIKNHKQHLVNYYIVFKGQRFSLRLLGVLLDDPILGPRLRALGVNPSHIKPTDAHDWKAVDVLCREDLYVLLREAGWVVCTLLGSKGKAGMSDDRSGLKTWEKHAGSSALLDRPRALAISPEGVMYVLDGQAGKERVLMVKLKTTCPAARVCLLPHAHALALSPVRRAKLLLVGAGNRIYQVSTATKDACVSARGRHFHAL